MSTTVDQIGTIWWAYRTRWQDRDERMLLMDNVVKGDWTTTGQDDEPLENRSPNLVQVALEDTAEAASLIPTIRVTPSSGSQASKDLASKMEKRAMSYLDMSQVEMLQIRSLLDLAGFGFFVWTVVLDEETGSPLIEWRDPRTTYPETGWRGMDSVRSCVFAREIYVHQLPEKYHDLVKASMADAGYTLSVAFLNRQVTLVEVFEEDFITIAALYHGSFPHTTHDNSAKWNAVQLERQPTPGGICPVVIGQRPTLDGEPRGQFDQVIGVMQAHIRLMAMVLDYSDQAVYSDIWVKDLVGQMPWGGGAVIQLGPQGAIGRVQPAVSSLQVQQELDSLINNIHLGGRWPKTRPGEIDQAIASAKFVEATAGMMNTVIRTMHLVSKRAMEVALRIAFKVDHEAGKDRAIAGTLRNQQFLFDGKKADIDLKARVRVDYGIGLGRDPAQTMVLGIQGMQTGMFSREYVQENFEGLTDVARENERIDVEKLKDMAMAQLLQGLQDKSIPADALVKIAQDRASGKDMFTLYQKYVIDAQKAVADQQVQGGLPGGPMTPGGTDPSQAGMPPPAAPPPDALLSGLGGGPGGPPGAAPPGGPPPITAMNQLSAPAGGRGNFVSTRSGG